MSREVGVQDLRSGASLGLVENEVKSGWEELAGRNGRKLGKAR